MRIINFLPDYLIMKADAKLPIAKEKTIKLSKIRAPSSCSSIPSTSE